MDELELLREADVARILSVSRQTLHRWRLNGTGPEARKLGSKSKASVRYPRTSLEKWISTRPVMGGAAEVGR